MNKSTKKGIILFSICILFCIFIYLMNLNSYRPSPFNGNTHYSQNIWTFGEENTPKKITRLSKSYDFVPGKTYELSTKLNYNGEQDSFPCAFITCGNFEVEAFLDDKLITHYTKEDRGFSSVQSMGTFSFTVPLDKNCRGKVLCLKLRSPFVNYTTSRNLPVIQIGDYRTIMWELFYQYLPNMLLSCAIIFNVIILLLLSNLKDDKQWFYVYFSIFSIFIIIFCHTQNLFNIYLRGKPYLVVFWEHVSTAASPIPLLLAYRCKFDPYYKKAFNWMIGVSSLNLILQLILNATGIIDFVPMIQVTHILIFMLSFFTYIIGIKIKHKTGKKHLFKTITPIIIGALVDVVSFYLHHVKYGKGGFFTVGNYISLGLLISLVLLILETRKERINNYKKVEKSKLLEKMAYKDALTGLNNRASYDMELNKIYRREIEKSLILCVSADINGLKTVNDSIGHHAGDQLICRAASLMNTYCSPYGKVFRIGGDEFFAILYDVNETQWKQIKNSLLEALEKENKNYEVPLSIAIGSTYLGSETIFQTIQLADHAMYRSKQDYHNKHNDHKKYCAIN